MGIPHLTRHLAPFSERVFLTGNPSAQQRQDCVQSVVIDGPSLVYHVFSRLLSWSDSQLEFPDTQPTCNEVSCAVMIFLLKLSILDVEIKAICFDGALPASKRDTRLHRLENARKKLQILRSEVRNNNARQNDMNCRRTIDMPKVLQSRAPTARQIRCLDNPFMVPSVFEDLKHRWSKENILDATRGFVSIDLAFNQEFPWADATVMVSDEADMHCAHVARLTGSAVLTNDSDLVLHDLGLQGSVVFLNSVELGEPECFDSKTVPILAERLCPTSIASRFNLTEILQLAYEVKLNPNLGLQEIIRLAQRNFETPVASASYLAFIEEYRDRTVHTSQRLLLDPRVSELVCQYECQENNHLGETLEMYLAILNEDPARRCAWDTGCSYRILGYSIFNISRPTLEQRLSINEAIRRGERIVKTQMKMSSQDFITKEIVVLCDRLRTIETTFQTQVSDPLFWRIFALCEIYGWEVHASPLPDVGQISQFLQFGYMGKRIGWADIHLTAQIQAVQYSLRILKQLVDVADLTDGHLTELNHKLDGLPPLHIMMRSRLEMIGGNFREELADNFAEYFGHICR